MSVNLELYRAKISSKYEYKIVTFKTYTDKTCNHCQQTLYKELNFKLYSSVRTMISEGKSMEEGILKKMQQIFKKFK